MKSVIFHPPSSTNTEKGHWFPMIKLNCEVFHQLHSFSVFRLTLYLVRILFELVFHVLLMIDLNKHFRYSLKQRSTLPAQALTSLCT